VKEVASIFKISERTFYRWLDSFLKDGIEGLKPKP